jgi:hypothetical protein
MPTPEQIKAHLDAYRLRTLGVTVVDVAPATNIATAWDVIAGDLNDKMGGLIAQGDAWQATSVTNNWSSAVAAYQTAGSRGATDVGPEIDAAGNPGVTQSYTQRAWTLNSALAAVNSSAAASEADAQLAEGYAKQMYGLYQSAIARGMGLTNPNAGSWGWGDVAIAAAAAGLVVGTGAFFYEAAKRTRRRGARRR